MWLLNAMLEQRVCSHDGTSTKWTAVNSSSCPSPRPTHQSRAGKAAITNASTMTLDGTRGLAVA